MTTSRCIRKRELSTFGAKRNHGTLGLALMHFPLSRISLSVQTPLSLIIHHIPLTSSASASTTIPFNTAFSPRHPFHVRCLAARVWLTDAFDIRRRVLNVRFIAFANICNYKNTIPSFQFLVIQQPD